MSRPQAPARHRLVLAVLAMAVQAGLHAQDFSSQSDWGGVGLLQTPTARMADEGELSLSASYTSPYARYNISMQPFPWMEGTFRYMSINNRRYGRPSLSGDQNFKDKSIDVKLRLWPESRHLPQVAFGVRDVGGTGLFSSEYLVLGKRFGNFDASLGLATGYIGNRGDVANPLRLLDDRFEDRRIPSPDITQAGRAGRDMFRGRIGLFGGVAWQTPLQSLLVKMELDGNDYQREPQGNNQRQRSPVNLGLVYRPGPGIEFTAGFERGTELVATLVLQNNLKRHAPVSHLLDRKPPALRRHAGGEAEPSAASGASAERSPDDGTDWASLAESLQREAGIAVSAISRRGRELVVHGEQRRYFYPAQGVGRATRVLDNALDGQDYDWVSFAHERVGMPVMESSLERSAFADYVDRRIDLQALSRKVELAAPALQRRERLYEAPLDRWRAGIGPGYKHVLGGPDGFVLYQLSADATASAWFDRSNWLTGTVSVDLHNNFHKFRYDAPSRLPRVRTWQRLYLTSSDVTVPNLQFTSTRQLSRDWYGMGYVGYLESMYGGLGGEVMYRPWGERWAVGLDLNRVRQRDFDQGAGFRDYQVTTGHLTGYAMLGRQQRVLARVSAGRYLAGDIGATFDLQRSFANGVAMGAYATFTNVSSRDFGEGSFDKGIYFSLPMDFLLPRPTRARVNVLWQPLFRDGGARLARRYHLYNLTGERDREFFLDNLEKIVD